MTARALRFYDKVGLLSPAQHSEAGYRLYSDEDLPTLQQILAFKFLGFSLEEIKVCLQTDTERLQEVLAMQKAMMQEKRARLDAAIQAITQAEQLWQTGRGDVASLVDVIRVMHMGQNKEWVNKYLTEEQQQKMAEISRKSYSPEAVQKLAEWGKGWSEADQERANQQWGAIAAELKRLTSAGADPAGSEAQAVAKQFSDLISQFTRGDADVTAGLKNWWKTNQEMPESERPIQMLWGKSEGKFLQQALNHHRGQK